MKTAKEDVMELFTYYGIIWRVEEDTLIAYYKREPEIFAKEKMIIAFKEMGF